MDSEKKGDKNVRKTTLEKLDQRPLSIIQIQPKEKEQLMQGVKKTKLKPNPKLKPKPNNSSPNCGLKGYIV